MARSHQVHGASRGVVSSRRREVCVGQTQCRIIPVAAISQGFCASRPVATNPVPPLPWLPSGLTSTSAILRAAHDFVEPGEWLAGSMEQGPIVWRNLGVPGRVLEGCAAPFVVWHCRCFHIYAWISSPSLCHIPWSGVGSPSRTRGFLRTWLDFRYSRPTCRACEVAIRLASIRKPNSKRPLVWDGSSRIRGFSLPAPPPRGRPSCCVALISHSRFVCGSPVVLAGLSRNFELVINTYSDRSSPGRSAKCLMPYSQSLPIKPSPLV